MNHIDEWATHLVPLLKWLGQNSAWASVMALLILAAQLSFGRWITPAWRYRLWGLLVLRLLLPATLPSPLSLANVVPAVQWKMFAPATKPAPSRISEPPRFIESAPTHDARHGVTVTYLPPPLLQVAAQQVPVVNAPPRAGRPASQASHTWSAIAGVWLLAMAIFIARLIVANIRLARRLRRAAPIDDPAMLSSFETCCREMHLRRRPQLLICSAVNVPAAAGIWKSKILFPTGLIQTLSPAERRTILLHELAHVRCHDVAANWLLAVLHAMHWFNPIVWLALAQLRADREMARDAMVLRHVAGNEANAYGQTLLRLAEAVMSRPVFSMAASAGLAGIVGPRPDSVMQGLLGGRAKLQRRLHMIASFNASGRRFAFVGPLLATVLAGCALTGAKPAESSASPDAPPASVAATSHAPATQPTANVAELTARSKQLIKEGKYAESLHVIDAILQLDPKNEYAIRIRPIVEDKTKFVELNRAKEEHLAVPPGESKEDRAVLDQLDRPIPELTFDGVGFDDVIDFLRDVSGSNIFVNWKALEAAGINKNAPVSAKLRSIKFSKALAIILDSVGGGGARLSFTVDDGVITISTLKDLAKNAVTRVYDIRDLLAIAPDFAPEDSKLSPSATQPANAVATLPSDAQEARKILVNDVMRLIEDTVAPESWRDRHGDVGSLRELQGQLIVTQTPENHTQIHRLLDLLREGRGIQISIESRLISCDDQIVRDLIARWGPSVKATMRNADHPSAKQPDTTATGVYLNPAQLDELLRAVKASPSSALIGAPRITLFNGQRAFVKVESSRAYVKDYATTRSKTGELRYDPIFDHADYGTIIDVQTTVSADRSFVAVTLRPQISVLLGLKSMPWPSRPADTNLNVQQPDVKTSSLQTTASIHNNDVLLVGGMEDPGIGGTPAATQPAGHLRGLFILVKPTIMLDHSSNPEFPNLTNHK